MQQHSPRRRRPSSARRSRRSAGGPAARGAERALLGRLEAAIGHRGRVGSGHYYAYARREAGGWDLFNDARVTRLTAAYVAQLCLRNAFERPCPVCGEDLFTSRHPLMGLACGHGMHFWCFEALKRVLKVIHSKVRFPHVLVNAAKVVVIMWKYSAASSLTRRIKHFYRFSEVSTLVFDVRSNKFTCYTNWAGKSDRFELFL